MAQIPNHLLESLSLYFVCVGEGVGVCGGGGVQVHESRWGIKIARIYNRVPMMPSTGGKYLSVLVLQAL